MGERADILVVDDDPEIRELLTRILDRHGFSTRAAANGREMRRLLSRKSVDLIILDIMMFNEDGIDLCRDLRRTYTDIPVIMLTAKDKETDKVMAFESGADDYITKPFSSRELVARIRAVRRRLERARDVSKKFGGEFVFEGWRFLPRLMELISPDDVTVSLSTSEAALLQVFVDYPQQLLSRDKLLNLTKGGRSFHLDRNVDTQISRLRRKLRDDVKPPRLIKTVWGQGYMFSPHVDKR